MSWFAGPVPGDWIKTTRPIKVTLVDHLLGCDAGIRPGTSGVITRKLGWNTLEAKLETGLFGSVTVRVKPRQVRVTRHAGGVAAYIEHAVRLRWMRAGVALALVGPLGVFCASYMLHGGTKSGLITTLVEGAIYGSIDLVKYAASNPINALLYIGAVSAAWRFAFRL